MKGHFRTLDGCECELGSKEKTQKTISTSLRSNLIKIEFAL